jgi:hypothetical protein
MYKTNIKKATENKILDISKAANHLDWQPFI